ncbi:MAG: methylmalonyl-CoA mutase family protein [Candidatus Puniceispirillales bacterium]
MNDTQDKNWSNWLELVSKTLGTDANGLDHITPISEDGLRLPPLYPGGAVSPHPVVSPLFQGWQMAQHAADSTDTKTLNRSILAELEGGTTFVMIPRMVQSGLAVHQGYDFPRLLDGVIMSACGFGFHHGQDSIALAAAWIDFTSGMDDKGAGLRVHLGADPIANMITGLATMAEAEAEGAALATWQKDQFSALPGCRIFAASGDTAHRLGLTQAQELAFGLSTLLWQWRCLDAAGCSPDQGSARLVMRIAVSAELYPALAKTRAARYLLLRLASVMGVVPDHLPVLHALTSDRMMTRIEPMNNILRNTTASLGAALGGSDLITTLPHDWLTGSTGMSRRLARNIQLIMRHEARLDQVADPAYGADALEAMSQELAAKAWQIFQEIEASGGALALAASGQVLAWAKQAATQRQHEMDNRNAPMLGVNHHPKVAAEPLPPIMVEAGAPRGGYWRVAAPWEDLRQSAFNRGLRCLVLYDEEDNSKGCAAWRDEARMLGIELAEIQSSDADELTGHINSAKPHILVLGTAWHSWAQQNDQKIHGAVLAALDASGDKRRMVFELVMKGLAG